MGILRAVKSFFSFLIKLIVVIVLMAAFALGSYEGVTYYLTGSFHDIRQPQKTAGESEEASQPESPELPEVESSHEDSIISVMFYEDTDYDYLDARLVILDKKTGVLDIVLLPQEANMSVTGKLKKDLSERLNVENNTVAFEDIARSFGSQKYEMIVKVLEENIGLSISSYDVMNKENMKEFLALVDPLDIELIHDITYRNNKHEIKIISTKPQTTESKDKDAKDAKATEEETVEIAGMEPEKVASYMRYADGSESQVTNRLQNNSMILEKLSSSLLNKMSALEIYAKYKGLIRTVGDKPEAEITEGLKKVTPESVTIRILQGAEANRIYSIDSQKAQLQINGLINQAASANGGVSDGSLQTEDGQPAAEGSKGYKIELYNAGYISGLAAAWQDYLTKHGYTITKIDNYKEGTLANTEIVVTQEGMGEDLLNYFPNATITVEDIPSGAGIVIYLGKDAAYMVPGHEKSKPEGVILDEDEDADEEDASTEATTEIQIIED